MDWKSNSGGGVSGGLELAHANNITVNRGASIGTHVVLFKGVTIGSVRSGEKKGCPQIGNAVAICTISVVVGNITIGDDVLIAANSFVNFNVPAHSVVIGNPAHIHHKENASADYCSR